MNREWWKRQAETAGIISILMGALTAIIVFFGGSFPPWYTPAQAQTDQRSVAKIQSDTVSALGKVTDRLDVIARRLDQSDCNHLLGTLEQAQTGLTLHPADQMARTLRDITQVQMRQIPGCTAP